MLFQEVTRWKWNPFASMFLKQRSLALAMFRDDGRTLRRLADHAHKNIVRWVEYDTGGHYAAHQVPELWLDDVRNFFRSLHQ